MRALIVALALLTACGSNGSSPRVGPAVPQPPKVLSLPVSPVQGSGQVTLARWDAEAATTRRVQFTSLAPVVLYDLRRGGVLFERGAVPSGTVVDLPLAAGFNELVGSPNARVDFVSAGQSILLISAVQPPLVIIDVPPSAFQRSPATVLAFDIFALALQQLVDVNFRIQAPAFYRGRASLRVDGVEVDSLFVSGNLAATTYRLFGQGALTPTTLVRVEVLLESQPARVTVDRIQVTTDLGCDLRTVLGVPVQIQ